VRSAISARSSWATAPSTCNEKHALWGGSVDRVAQAAEVRASSFQLLDDGQQMADGAGETIEPDHDLGFAGADVA
jgi:hypothetical protein